jgi:hypothetical protein
MKRVLKLLAILLSISTVFAGDKDTRFAVKPATEYPARLTQEKVTVAAMAYVNEDDVKLAFGKTDPNKYGVLPVLVVIQNDSGKPLRLNLQAEFVDRNGHHVDATPASEVHYVGTPPKRKDSNIGMGSPLPFPLPKKKGGPLGGWEIDGRSMTAKMIPAGEQVSGFFYFQARLEPGSKLYLNGLSEAGSGKELFYFEVPLEK